jgi:hypothetical protein
MSLQDVTPDTDINRTVLTIGDEENPDDSLTLTIYSSYSPGQVEYFLDTEPTGELTINNMRWNTYYLAEGYSDGPELNDTPILGLQLEYDSVLYSVRSGSAETLTPNQELILSTFQFFEAEEMEEEDTATDSGDLML